MNMAEFLIEPPARCPGWVAALTTPITAALNKLNEEMESMNTKMDSMQTNFDDKFEKFSTEIMKDVVKATKLATDAIEITKSYDERLHKIEINQKHMNVKYDGVVEYCKQLEKRCDNQESYSRRNNLLIRGIIENDENADDCARVAKDFFVHKLSMTEDEVNRIEFVRCHRIGKKALYNGGINKKRPIIVRFEQFSDKSEVWGKRFQLKDKNYSISENFANDVEYRRRLLYPVLVAAKKSGNYDKKAFLNGDVLLINNVAYTMDNIDELPKDIHPYNLSYKENDQWLIFGGMHSIFNYLSNYYKQDLTFKGVTYDNLESAYQHQKAERFGDSVSSSKILCARSPAEAKRIGSKIRNFNSATWNNDNEAIMLELLRIKFAPGTALAQKLMSTARKSLAEAGFSEKFAIGVPLHHKDLFDTTKWKKNLLGQALMKIRQELIK